MKMAKNIILGLLCVVSVALGTAQDPESLIYKGKTNDLLSLPLETYFSTNRPIPDVWEIMILEPGTFGSGCWRGYIGTWEIKENALYLSSINFPWQDPEHPFEITYYASGLTNTYRSPEPILFPNNKLPIKADWFSGILRVPSGKQLKYVHMGFGSIYEYDLYIKVDNGNVIEETTVTNKNNPKLYISDADLQWQSLGVDGYKYDPFSSESDNCKDADWVDARTIPSPSFSNTIAASTSFITRGILLINHDETFEDAYLLYIPETPLSPEMFFPLSEVPDETKELNGVHVEIEAKFRKAKKENALDVTKIRALQPGESMHQTDFRMPDEYFEKKEKEINTSEIGDLLGE